MCVCMCGVCVCMCIPIYVTCDLCTLATGRDAGGIWSSLEAQPWGWGLLWPKGAGGGPSMAQMCWEGGASYGPKVLGGGGGGPSMAQMCWEGGASYGPKVLGGGGLLWPKGAGGEGRMGPSMAQRCWGGGGDGAFYGPKVLGRRGWGLLWPKGAGVGGGGGGRENNALWLYVHFCMNLPSPNRLTLSSLML